MNKNKDLLLIQITDELIHQHQCHTVILYGSRARGDATLNSDYDILGVRKKGNKYRIAEKREGKYLDIFIYPEKELTKVGEEHLYMSSGIVLYEQGKFGTSLIKKLNSFKKKKYKPLTENEIKVIKVWLHKMFDRINQGDIEGNYRRVWLQEALLIEYFNIRKKRFEGSKSSFEWLKKNDITAYRLFDRVLKNPLDLKLLKKLVILVTND